MPTIKERFESKVFPDANSGCWIWEGPVGSNGYGSFWVDGKTESAHRASWALHVGLIPDGMSVLHKCHVRVCCNPNHLYIGTQKQNNEDTARAGRNYFKTGALNPRPSAKLTERTARQIYEASGAQRLVAARFGVSQATVSEIKTKKIWSHIHANS